MPVIGVAEVLVKPTFKGTQAEVSQIMDGISTNAGRSAGQRMARGVSTGFSEGVSKLKSEVAAAEKTITKSQAQISAAQSKIASSTEAEAKALGAVRVAELKLQEVRDNSKAKASQVAAAEEALQNARRKAATATDSRKAAEKSLTDATTDLKSAQDQSAKSSAELEKKLKGVGDQAGESEKKVSRLGSAVSSGLKWGAVAVGTAAVATLGVALTKGFSRLQAIENARAKLTGLGHDAEAVKGIMNDAMAAVKGTAFGLDEAASVAAGAVAAGVKPGKELERTLKLTGDAATIAGVGMGEMGAIFNKVASSNKIQGDVIAQLNDAGIPIVQLLGKELGKTAEETLNLASEGKINFETFQKAMESGLGGAALKSGETLQGAFKNTMASLGRIGASLLSGVYPKIRDFFAGAIEWLKPLEEGAKVAGAAVGAFLDRALTGAQGLWDLLVKGDFTGKLTAAFGREEDAPLVGFLLKARDGAIGLYDLLVKGDYTGMLRKAFGWEEDSRFVDFLLTVRDTVLKIPDALTKVIDGGSDVATFLWDMRAPIGIISGLIITALIPHWVSLGVTALTSAVSQKLAWGMAQTSAAKAAFVHSWAVTVMVGGWIAMGAAALKSAAETVAIWLMYQVEPIKAVASMLAARAVIVGSWIMMGVQATINAAKIAAGWLIAMGPVGWIIGIIAAVVAAFVWAYNNVGWFKDGVDAAMRWIGDAFTWLYENAVKPAFDGISFALGWLYNTILKPTFNGIVAAVNFVAAGFTWFYTTVLKPIFDSAAVIIGGFYLFFRGIGQLVASVFTYILVPIFMFFWNLVVDGFRQIGDGIALWWNVSVAIFNQAVAFVRDVLSGAFTWLYDSIIRPVFDGIAASASWLWNNILKPTFDSWVWFFTVVIPNAVTWLYQNAIKPIFDAIGAAGTWLWNNMLKPVFDTWIWFFTTVIPNAANWLWQNAIKPAFDGIGSAVSWVWENVLKPVFDFLAKAINEDIPKAFELGVSAVKKAWDTISDIAKAPVRFVINTVINDGLINAFNGIADVLPGIDKLPRVALPEGFRRGGILPGMSSWRDGDDQLVPMRKGEGVYVSEVMRDPMERARLFAMNRAAIMGQSLDKVRAMFGVGLAKGGLVHPLRASTVSQPFSASHNGIDFAAPTGTPIVAAGPGRVSSAGWSSYGGGNEIHIDHPNGLQTWYAHLSSFAVKLGQMVSAGMKIGEVGSTGNSTGSHLHYMVLNGGWPSYVNPAAYLDGGGEAGTGWNPIAGIIDGLLGAFKDAFPAAGMMADIAIGVGKKLLLNVSDFITGQGGKDDGIGSTGLPYLHDQGGILSPGLSQVVNRTQKPEYILNPRQWEAMYSLADRHSGAPGAGVQFNGPVHVRDEHELVRLMETSQRDALALTR
ncbi:peptidoglycan DD-metalloendopeptidase family protein [Paenarthrobacter sp. AT5]|uniref:peptidoglycan DD-metalloendopeptidase family protein n=1 Tax=Paenarthrobacter TaxID=1742992 RepID=UPI001A98773F|nr:MULTISPECIES: peptidoglycan DD-metalloendopeptidase family protein [Paenarthrobacter]QSZ53270.1 hypothetical protein AYX19_09810 [Paenarthrobacter ureafaciens]WOC59905.1 peptidoglycan DD-metalloendopeptidase family protein [Paenarthrobacter sp. AT5]